MGGSKRRTPKTPNPKQRNQLASTVYSRDNSPSPNTNSPFDPNAPVTYAGLDAQLQSHLQKTIDALNAQLDEISLVANNSVWSNLLIHTVVHCCVHLPRSSISLIIHKEIHYSFLEQ